MVFTQGRGFVIGASFGLQIRSLRCRVLVCSAADTASLATWFLFGKLFCVATLVDFGEKRCRKNLPLYDLPMSDSDPNDDLPPGAIVPSSPIEYWAAVGNLEQVQRAIDDGHDINASDNAGYTALHAAAENNHIDIAKLLLQHGASKTAAVSSGETPADLAALSGHHLMVNLLSD